MDDFDGKRILVTGGTGSFGRAFIKYVLRECNPEAVIAFSRDEQKHYRLQREVGDGRLRCFVGDVRDRNRLARALRGVDCCVHAAAMKHVPVCEYNPTEAIDTNINGARNVIDAAIENEVKKVVVLSTDKAVEPINLYGATKLAAEKLFIAAHSYSRETCFSLVRYGNVLGSEGSVVPLFKKQHAESGQVTITDIGMTRFWIRMETAIQTVMDAFEYMQGGEIFIPPMRACKVTTLVDALCENPAIKEIGIRPGEKMHEVIMTDMESHHAWIATVGGLVAIAPHTYHPPFAWANAERGEVRSNDFHLQMTTATVRELLANV